MIHSSRINLFFLHVSFCSLDISSTWNYLHFPLRLNYPIGRRSIEVLDLWTQTEDWVNWQLSISGMSCHRLISFSFPIIFCWTTSCLSGFRVFFSYQRLALSNKNYFYLVPLWSLRALWSSSCWTLKLLTVYLLKLKKQTNIQTSEANLI